MTTPQPSLTVTFENPKMKVSLAGSTSAGLDLGADLGAKFEHAGDWAAPTRVNITPGSHHVEAYFKLKGLPVKRGKGKADFTASDGDVSVQATFAATTTTTEVKVPGQPAIRKKRLVF
ncbi:MAG TPA: hypothetical protein VE400_21680 [Mycobacterium sp.]|jgi:hypothetical protein|nr:hypothetical protein [Mycobacterium sp.]